MTEKYPYQIVREHIDLTKTSEKRNEIIKAFAQVINSFSLENDSNTPDFILAEYLWDCLMTANILIGSRSIWYNPYGIKATFVDSPACERHSIFDRTGQIKPGETIDAEQVSTDGRTDKETE